MLSLMAAMKKFIESTKNYLSNYLLSFLQAQLVVSIVSIPILVGWGLPISLMTFFGNLVFAPILIAFLVLSSLIFFAQLLHIPNHFLIYILKIISSTWINFLELGTRSWLWGFYRPHTYVLVAIPAVSFAILYLIRFKSAKFKTVAMSALLFAIVVGLTIFPYFKRQHLTKTLANGKLTIEIDPNFQVKFTDNGYFNKHQSTDKIVDYDIKQFLIKNTGKTDIDSLILLRPGYRTFKAGQECCNRLNVKSLSMPFFDGSKFKKSAWREYFNLKRTTDEHGIPILRIKNNTNSTKFAVL